ncbi:MAG TPA: hypothetical protein PL048_17350 [Leptospiraceae bacterium]|nr:hypothetical protein [Leptospiraceae bacterium]
MNEKDQIKYNCNPYKLSYDIYGTTDFGFTILYINNLSHPGELDLSKPIKMLTKDNIEFISIIFKNNIT